MQDIPITIEASSSELSSECIPTQESEDHGEYLSILDMDACMPIAIVGMGFRGPSDATNVESLWKMIIEQREGWTPIPKERWNSEAFYHPDHARHGTINVEGGHFIQEDLSLFDAPFFNMTGDEAATMDPQQRLLLEITYEGLENAGIPLSQFMGSKTSCFVGSFSADYMDILLRDPECVPMYQCTNAGQSRAMVANRISYFFDLKGPSVTVDTACSGSLVALHLACQSLQTGDASMAVAAGVNLILSHEFMSTMSMMRFLSPDGRCYTFDEQANGYARGEAVGCLILKPLADAIRDQNTIRAVIRGSGSNQDGRTPGITLPSGAAQEALIRDVYARAGLDPKETEVVEAHGTGTQAGDPIETGAISRVFGSDHDRGQTIRIGSIKTNVGHLEGASGVAGVIKAVLMLENRTILPSRNFTTPNPRIPLEEWNLKVQSTSEPWEATGPHRVSVNSFGYGGSNAHVIVEDALGYLASRGLQRWLLRPSNAPRNVQPNPTSSEWPSERHRIFMVCGFDEWSCHEQVRRLRDYLSTKQAFLDDKFMDDLAFTLSQHRSRFMWKTAVIGTSIANLIDSFSGTLKMRSSVRRPTVAFIFTGQGAQWAGMGKELLNAYPVFRESISKIDEFLKTLQAPFRVYDEITRSSEESHLSHPLLSQTVCSALQLALVDLLASWGVYPASVTGHSSGEIAAAYACGALGMEDAMSIAYQRGVAASQLLTTQVQGGMMAISMSPEEVKPHLARIESGKAVIACINSPSSVTVSGDTDAIDELTKALENNPAFSRRLAVDVAYHSHHMELVANEYLNSIEHITPRKPNIDNDLISFFSSVTGTEIYSDSLGPPYWVSNLLCQVKFAESVKKLCFETKTRHTGIGITAGRRAKRAGTAQKPSVDFILEIGPHSALSAPVKQILQADVKLRAADIEYASILVRRKPAVSCALDSMTKLATLNYPLDFESINRPETSNQRVPRLLVDLPPYSWNHTRSYWAEPRMSKTYRSREFPRTNLLGALDNMACPFEPRWRNYLRVSEIPWLMDHKIQSDIVFPAAGYICMAIEAAMQLAADIGEIAAFSLQDISIRSALIIPESVGIEIMTSLHTLSEGRANRSDSAYRFHAYSVSKDNRWTEHCTGIIGVERKHGDTGEVKIDLDGSAVLPESETANISVVDVGQLYERLRHVGLDYGPCFANLTSAHATDSGACFAEITLPNTAAAMPMQFEHPLLIHPCALDSMFHAIFATLADDTSLQRGPLLPVSIESMRVAGGINTCVGEVLSTCTHVRTGPEDTVVASIVAGDSNVDSYSLTPMISVTGLRCKRLDLAPNDSRSSKNVPLVYEIEWQPDPEFIAEKNNPCRILEQNAKFANRSSFFEECENYTTNFIKDFLTRSAQHDRTRHDSVVNKYRSSLAELLQGDNPMTEIPSIGEAKQTELPTFMTRLLHAMGTHLSSISDEDSKSIQESRTELWNVHWEILATNRTYQCAARYLELIGNKKPDISVLQICEGTGQPCTMFLQCFTAGRRDQNQAPRCIKYTFTFKDNAELDQMKPRLAPWSELIGFTKLDIERDISDQAIESHSYDVIVAPHGLHSVQSMKHAIENLRSMLTPSGYLLIVDHFHTERSILDAMMINALYLWPTETFHSPSKNDMKNNNLVQALQEADFTTCNLAQESPPTGHNDILMLSRLRANMELTNKSFTIISEKNHNESVVKALQHHIEDLGCKVKLTDIANIQAKGEICVLLSDMQMQMQMLASIKSDILEKVKDIFLHSAGVLWITSGGTVDPTCPEAGLASGFARTARSESGIGPIITLDLDSLNPLPDYQTAEVILRVIKTHFLQKGNITEDTEYSERGGIVSIPRVVEREDMNPAITRVSQDDKYSEQPFRQKNCPVRLSRADMNHPQPYFTQDSEMAELPAGHVGIEVLAFGLSECDTYQRSGVKKLSDTLGLECSGKVCALGQGVEGFSMGDRVVCLGIGTAGTFYHNEASAFQKIDDSMSYELAAALSVAYTTAYYVVHYLARIRPHDIVLIQDAASWYGQAITEVCYMRSAAIIATVESSAQKEALSNRFRIPPHRVLIDGDENFPKQILEITNGQKANVAISLSATKSLDLQEIWKCVASFGRLIQLRTRDDDERGDLSCPVRNVVFSTFDIFEFQTERTDITRHILGKIMRLFHEGRLRGPPSVMVRRVREIEKALDALTSEKHVVITTGGDDVVKTIIPKEANSLFRGDASYILVGGLGGIGRAIALWMSDHGAKHVIFVNRSGLSGEPAQATVRKLRAKNMTVAVYACDISNQTEVAQMFVDISETQLPVRGLIHGAMVLKDIHIERMTAEDYNAVLRSRYNGTWNLHRHSPTNLDFFLMLSSISGVIGNATQSAYAAGSAFMDAFAAYRNAMGLPGVSLDLGTITDVGYLAANKGLATRMEKQGFKWTDTSTLLELVKFAIAQPSGGMAQIVTGLGEWKEGESLGNFDAPLFSHFRHRFRRGEESGGSDDAVQTLRDMLRACKTKEEAVPIVFDAVSGKIAAQLDISVDRIDPSSPLSEFGADSHVAVELRNWISKTLDSAMSILEILASDSVLHLAGQIAGRSQLVSVDDEQ